jgi:2-iminoacetate synthase
MITLKDKTKAEKNFIDPDYLKELLDGAAPSPSDVDEVLNRALDLKGLSLTDAAVLLRAEDEQSLEKLLKAAEQIKQEIYGKRIVLFAPLYIGNKCSNNCTYCAFRASNRELKRVVLNTDQIKSEVEHLLAQGHKRLLMLCGESKENDLDYFLEAIQTAYSVSVERGNIRRINVEIAPLEVDEFSRLKKAKIGTYACFQETYDPELYKRFHPSGPKADYEYRLNVMDRAMLGDIDDVGIGALFGLGDYRFDTLGLIRHAEHLEEVFGCGPHTVSVPRVEPAQNAPDALTIPHAVSDTDFKKIIAVLRVTLPYTGIILSTRETEQLRNKLFRYGISQISAASRTNPGAYSEEADAEDFDASQFSLGDHRTLDEVISHLIDMEYIPSFCTGCYRKGRVGQDFMDMAKPGLIKQFCMPNGVFTFMEYLHDYASPGTRDKGFKLVDKILKEEPDAPKADRMREVIGKINRGERDLYY